MPQSQEETVSVPLTEKEIDEILKVVRPTIYDGNWTIENLRSKLRAHKDHFSHDPEPCTDA